MKTETCNRCDGAGKISWSSCDGGICYACRGSGKLWDGTNRKWSEAPSLDGESFRITRNNADSDYRRHSWVVESKVSGLAIEIGRGFVNFDADFPEGAKSSAESWARAAVNSWCAKLPSRYRVGV